VQTPRKPLKNSHKMNVFVASFINLRGHSFFHLIGNKRDEIHPKIPARFLDKKGQALSDFSFYLLLAFSKLSRTPVLIVSFLISSAPGQSIKWLFSSIVTGANRLCFVFTKKILRLHL